jgi:hypothetical protein
MQEVKILLEISGDYVAFHEISADILYDLTNDILLDKYSYESLEEIQEAMGGERDYGDIKEVNAIRTEDGRYFYQL